MSLPTVLCYHVPAETPEVSQAPLCGVIPTAVKKGLDEPRKMWNCGAVQNDETYAFDLEFAREWQRR